MDEGVESDWFEIESGVRQGDALSPLLFIIFMDKCIRDIGVNVGSEETLMYADDVAVFTDNVLDIQAAADRWQDGMKQKGMKINTKKVKQN